VSAQMRANGNARVRGSDELRAWFGSGNAVQSDTHGSGHVLSKTEYARLTSERVAA